jgi:3-isopropylmalate/(R)-2-methylmalate dehydratase large subunit
MAMTVSEKILAAHAGLDEVRPGQLVTAGVDLALGSDPTAPLAIEQFEKAGASTVFDKDKVVMIPDHFAPNKDVVSAQKCKLLREFSAQA